MKQVLLILLLGISLNGFSQKINIHGTILSENQIPIVGATIQINERQGTATDEFGDFDLIIEQSKVEQLFKIRMLGYEDLDTLIEINRTLVYFEVVLKREASPLTPIEITTDNINLFSDIKWNILDFCFLEDKYFVLSYIKNKRKLFVFSESGNIICQKVIESKSNNLLLSCENRIHLFGPSDYAEIFMVQDSIILVPYEKSLFDNLINKCAVVNNGEYIFKELSDHNKRANYFNYPEAGKPKLIKEIVDVKANKVSNSYYRQIISLYNRTVENPGENDIAYGMMQTNIIAENEWSGDVKDLIISNGLHMLVAYYLNVECREINLFEFSINDMLLIFDLNNRVLYQIDLEKDKVYEINLDEIENSKKCQIIKDQANDNLYLINKNKEIYKLAINEQSVAKTPLLQLRSDDIIFSKFQIINHVLFYTTRKVEKPLARMNKIDLN